MTAHRRVVVLLAVVSLAAVLVYLLISRAIYATGFPLDDAWIHQTYARNLATFGQWFYLPGTVSAGSTAPAWSLLLTPGHWLAGEAFRLWTYGLGAASLFGLALAGERFARLSRVDGLPGWAFAGLFLATEWHLVWAAGSGMETGLMAVLMVGVFALLLSNRSLVWAGLLAGASIWVRPDGLTLLGPALWVAVLGGDSWGARACHARQALLGFLLPVVPYLAFNWQLAGTWWPNTFYAKQAEYAILRSQPLLTRLGSIGMLPLVGAGSLLLPGFLYLVVRSVRERRWALMAAWIWWAGFTLIYALRLPVTYQHGRYLMPAMPVYFLLGLLGIAWLIRSHLHGSTVKRVLRRAWVLAIVLVQAAFFVQGGLAYAGDVAIIETEMVATADWLAENTRPEDRLAVHDIGAIGYFAPREMVDLAGLVSPDVIPFIRDETRLAEYLDQQQVDYLVTFPAWYPQLIQQAERVYCTGAEYAPRQGGENLCVYRWLIKQP